MAKNSMEDLRNHLFETIEKLQDEEKPLEIERAKAICSVASKLIDSAKVEVKFLEVTGAVPASSLFSTMQPRLPAGRNSQPV
jgi:hypothetical protein